jgi:hypothetical protein
LAKKSRITTPAATVAGSSQAERLENRRNERTRSRSRVAESRKRQQRIQKLAIGAIAVVLIAAVGFWAFRTITNDPPGESVGNQGGGHVANDVTVDSYNSDPPTSGEHWASTTSWGIHDEPVPNELQVHNLEHGGIVIQYNSSVSDEEINQLEQIVAQCNVKLLLAPRPDMTQRIAVTAWTWKLDLDVVDTVQINDFISAHVNNGPERIPTESQLLDRCDL